MTQSYSVTVTPVSQSQGFIPVWPLAASAHGKYHFMARNLPCVRTENIIVELLMHKTYIKIMKLMWDGNNEVKLEMSIEQLSTYNTCI